MINGWVLRVLVAWQGPRRGVRQEEGQTLAEYGLIMSFIAVSVIVLAVVGFRGSLTPMFNDAAACINRVTC